MAIDTRFIYSRSGLPNDRLNPPTLNPNYPLFTIHDPLINALPSETQMDSSASAVRGSRSLRP